MLYQFSFKNFKSYKSETVFDMRAENIDEFKDSLIIDQNDTKLLPVSVIYGPNAGGKSGLIEALVCFISIVLQPRKSLEIDNIDGNKRIFAYYNNVIPYKFDDNSINEPTEFQVFFSTKSREYKYNLKVKDKTILEESLEKKEFNAKKSAKIFSRKKDKISLGEILKKASVSINVNENIPYLTFLSITNKIEIIDDVIGWFKNITAINYAKEAFEGIIALYDDDFKDFFIKILNSMDIDICDYRTEEKENGMINIFTKHKNNDKIYELNFEEESEGTKKVFSIIPHILVSLAYGGLLILDELDAKLHTKLLKYIIMIFKNRKLNSNNAQLIFTSQDIMTMSNEIFRRDEIWYACKNENNESEIYSLYDVRDEKGEHIRANAAYGRQYLNGKYGADPYLDKMLDWKV